MFKSCETPEFVPEEQQEQVGRKNGNWMLKHSECLTEETLAIEVMEAIVATTEGIIEGTIKMTEDHEDFQEEDTEVIKIYSRMV